MNASNPGFDSLPDAALRRVLAGFPQLALALVFGSVARGTPRPDSDLDIAVARHWGALQADERMALIAALAQETGRPIDLIDLRTASPPLLGQIIAHGRRVWGDDTAHAQWISRNLFDQADFAPCRNRLLEERRAAWMQNERLDAVAKR
jgi:predicted nucleotidyltransferase